VNLYRVSFILNGTRMSTMEQGYSRSEAVEKAHKNFPGGHSFEVFDIN